MATHLTPAEFVDAIDGALDVRRQAHLDACAACRGELETLRVMQQEVVEADAAPNPSPLFWPIFTERLTEATNEPPVSAESGWARWARPLLAAATVLAVTMLVANPWRSEPAPGAIDPQPPPTAPTASVSADQMPWDEIDSWQVVVDVASAVAPEEAHEVATLRPGTADRMIEALTPEEQAELIRLLQAEMGGSE